jgi:hypothetical protein
MPNCLVASISQSDESSAAYQCTSLKMLEAAIAQSSMSSARETISNAANAGTERAGP